MLPYDFFDGVEFVEYDNITEQERYETCLCCESGGRQIGDEINPAELYFDKIPCHFSNHRPR